MLHAGLGPEDAFSGQIAKVIAFALEAAGAPIVKGGARNILAAFEALIKERGGDIRTGADVASIVQANGRVGNLTSVKRPEEEGKTKIEDTYTYDGNNLRQSQTINGTKTNLTWDTAEEETVPVILSDESNFYIYGPENIAVEQITSGGASQWMHHDQQGSTRMIMNLKGEVEASYTFNPYGSLNASKGPNNSLLRYNGEYTSTDNGLIYCAGAPTTPNTAQFLSVILRYR